MLEARKSPITSILTDDPKVILRATGILSRIWRLTLVDLNMNYVKWRNNVDDYIDRCVKEYPNVDLSNTKGNLGKALARDEVTWDVFCKGTSLLKLKKPTLVLTLTLGDVTNEFSLPVPFTCSEDRGKLLAALWKKIFAAFPEQKEKWEELVMDYSIKQKKLGMNLADSLKSNLTNALKTDSITWVVFTKGIEVLVFDKVVIKLTFKAPRGIKEIVLNPK